MGWSLDELLEKTILAMRDCEDKVNEEVAMKWLSQGALPTDTARNLLSKKGVMAKFAESKKGNK